MDLTKVILGEVVTEKGIRLKESNSSMIRVHPKATKIDVKNALRRHFGVEPKSVRILRVVQKKRLVGRGVAVRKREAEKRAIVTLASKSKQLDLTVLRS